ncbi:MAG: prepilin peptidase [Promethearchaeia archaeon]
MVYALPEILAFFATVGFLSLIGYYDFKKREIDNTIMVASAILGGLLTLLSGHLFEFQWQHLVAVPFTVVLATILFNVGAIGGADLKALVIISIISPRIEFHDVLNPIFECVISISVQILVMLILGQIWYILNRKQDSESETVPPLLPFLLIGYISIQIIPLLVIS